MVRGLAASLSQGIAVSPSFCPFSFENACGHCLSSCQRQEKSAVIPHPRSPGQWPTAPSVDSVRFDSKYQRPSVVNSLLRAKSDIRPGLLDLGRMLLSVCGYCQDFSLLPLEVLSERYFHNVTS